MRVDAPGTPWHGIIGFPSQDALKPPRTSAVEITADVASVDVVGVFVVIVG